MAPKELDGNNLGEKHRHYNILVKEAVAGNKLITSDDLNSGENDVDNLLTIDIASSKRDVDYIIKVLKCDDMLYVSRAIKKSKWLITDRQYSHIINPNYLHTELMPQMTSKASAKLMLHVRLALKDEARVEDFYNYYREKDIKLAIKWLPHCPLSLLEKEVEKHYDEINNHLLKRLCERSITVLDKYIQRCEYYKRDKLKVAMFLINSHTEKYLDIVETLSPYQIPPFGPKYTDKIMKVCPQRVKDKFEKYADKIDVKTFAKHIKKEEIQDFIRKQADNKELKCWFNYNNLKHLINFMPKEGRFDFLKKFFIEGKDKRKDGTDDEEICESDDINYCSDISMKCRAPVPPSSSANIYRWYYFAPFDTAFADLTKLIRAESSPTERLAMFSVLLSCAGRNIQHVQTVLQYYHDKHINEPFKFRIQFVNMLLSKTNTHKFDVTTWNILNNIFYSMEVYAESNHNVQFCIEAIIVYHIVHDQTIPENIEKKFKFNSLQTIRKKLNKEENEKVFKYLYKTLETKINNKVVNTESELTEAISILREIESLLSAWKRDIVEYPLILQKISEFLELKIKNCWKVNMSFFYTKNKSWRKKMFEQSLRIAPCEGTCINALKHDPELLSRYKNEVEKLQRDDKVSLQRLLRTLRLYWPQTLAAEWMKSYFAKIKQVTGHKALVRGLCALLPQKQLIEVVTKHAPTETKINWSEDDEVILSLRKQLAKSMHVSRPLPPIDAVLLYAKGDYLQFCLPSLSAVLHNMSCERTYEHVAKLLDAPVSLQKHGIRLAFSKLDSDKLKIVFFDIWKSTKNPSIRAVLFKQTYELLCREKKNTTIEEIWELLSIFVDNLSSEENKTIYETLGKVEKVPILVRGKFLMKSYKFLKTLPAKANCESVVNDVISNIRDLMVHLDQDFVAELLLDSIDQKFTTKRYEHSEIMAAYLLCSKDDEDQCAKFRRVLLPVLERSFALWNVKVEGTFCASHNVLELLRDLSRYFQKFVFECNMNFPSKLFSEILIQLEQRLAIESNYMTLRTWKLITTYVMLLEEQKSLLPTIIESADSDKREYYDPQSEKKWNEIYLKAIPKFSDMCSLFLTEDVEKYFSSIYLLLADALESSFSNINRLVYYECLSSILENNPKNEGYLMVIKLLPKYQNDEDEEGKKIIEIRKKIFANSSTEVKFHYYRNHPDMQD